MPWGYLETDLLQIVANRAGSPFTVESIDPPIAAFPANADKAPGKRRGGRKRDAGIDRDRDRRIFEAVQKTGSRVEAARDFDADAIEIRQAVDRHRKSLKASGKN
jgi:hypothetical protein